LIGDDHRYVGVRLEQAKRVSRSLSAQNGIRADKCPVQLLKVRKLVIDNRILGFSSATGAVDAMGVVYPNRQGSKR
jgi:hypothetical protein